MDSAAEDRSTVSDTLCVEVLPGRTLECDACVHGVPGLGGLMQLGDGVKLVICMVGISGCGKTYLLLRYFRFNS